MTNIHSFDGTENVRSALVRPDRYGALYAALRAGTSIPRGAGLSYCAAGAGAEARSVQSFWFNRLLAFDAEAGRVTVETGMRLGDLFRFTVPRGWVVPVMPGHPFITVGGCIGCNVHGKNHFRDGCFENVVESLTLFHPDHGELACSREQRPELFALTVGGFGLTGYVTTATLRLQRIAGASVRMQRIPASNLAETVRLMESRDDAALLYSWNDFNRSGDAFGRGFVCAGYPDPEPVPEELVDHPLSAEDRGRGRPPAYFPLSTRALTALYSWAERLAASEKRISLAAASFPPNGKEFYFHLFGRRGFREYQVLVARDRWDELAGALPALLKRHGVPVTLASLKLFKGQGSLLRFDGTGVCLALDAPEGAATRGLFEGLDELTAAAGGIVNIAKDSRLTASFVRRVFPQYDLFRDALNRFDPRRRFDSALRRRLDV
jgi:decaprenylphospho-beta-D-ribofuranose 2-oxidase